MSSSLKPVISAFSRVLDEEGPHAALRFLNARTRYRFTGVYRFDPPMLRSIHLFDRENPTLHVGEDSLMRDTYCSVVGTARAPFSTADAGKDERLAGHPARESVAAYCGAPLLLDDGHCFGTLCHFDLRPRVIPTGEIPLLECVAPLVAKAVSRQGQIA